jgi:succinyl-CoA synthetase alpha subunit
VAIFLTGGSRVMIQGITGAEGRKHGARMLAAGTTIVGGTNPRKAGQRIELGGTGVPVFGTVAEVMAATGADVSVVFVPVPLENRICLVTCEPSGVRRLVSIR